MTSLIFLKEAILLKSEDRRFGAAKLTERAMVLSVT